MKSLKEYDITESYLEWLSKTIDADKDRLRILHSIDYICTDYQKNANYGRDTNFIQNHGGPRGELPFGSYIGEGPRRDFWLYSGEKDEVRKYFCETAESFLEFVCALAWINDRNVSKAKDHHPGKWVKYMLDNAHLLDKDIKLDYIYETTKKILNHETNNGKMGLFNLTKEDEFWDKRDHWLQNYIWVDMHEYNRDDSHPHSTIYGDWKEGWYEYWPNCFQIGLKGISYDADIYVDDFDHIPKEAKQTWFGNENKPILRGNYI